MKRLFITMAACGLAAMLVPSAASAAEKGHDTGGHPPPSETGMKMEMDAVKGDQGPSSEAFAKANARMHEAMDVTFTGNADVDFARSMIAHHQGAIDMARVELEYGKDPDLRKLADGIIAAQESEIAMMKGWLAKQKK